MAPERSSVLAKPQKADDHRFVIARRICAAVGSHEAGVSFETFLKRYVPEDEVGELWLAAADIVIHARKAPEP